MFPFHILSILVSPLSHSLISSDYCDITHTLRLQSASATVTQTAVTSPSGHGCHPVAPVGGFATTADTTLSGVGVSAVATATAATRPCP